MARPISRPDGGASGDAGRADRPRRMLKPIQPDQLTWRTGTGNIEPTPGSAPRSSPHHRATTNVPLSVPEGLPVTPSRRRLLLAAATTLALTGAGAGAAHADPPPDAPEQIDNGDFSAGVSPWFSFGTGPLAVTDGRLCTTVAGGLANPWDAGIGQDGVPLIAGAEYTLGFAVSATPGAAVKAVLQLGSAPYTTYAAVDASATGTAQRVEQTFTVPDDNPNAQLIFQVGGSARGADHLPGRRLAARRRAARAVRAGHRAAGAGQPGRLPARRPEERHRRHRGHRGAALAASQRRRRRRGQRHAPPRVASTPPPGRTCRPSTSPATAPPAPGSRSPSTARPATRSTSPATLYDQLRSDSLQFFYAQRSGIAIDGDLIGDEYARPAGHLGVAPNQGDTNVPCQPGVCDYSPRRARRLVRRRRPRQVRGQRRHRHLPAAEHLRADQDGGHRRRRRRARRRHAAASPSAATACRTSSTRPAGSWSSCCACRCRPASRSPAWPTTRSTTRTGPACRCPARRPAAARAAPAVDRGHPQPGRHRRPVRPAVRPLRRGVRRAAAALPRRRPTPRPRPTRRCTPSPTDGTGGGAYDDNDVTDEFYWAAAELYLTTGAQTYLTDLTASPHHTGDVFDAARLRLAERRRAGPPRPGHRAERAARRRPGPRPRLGHRRRRHATSPSCAGRRTGCRCPVTPTATSGAATATSSTTPWCWPPRST